MNFEQIKKFVKQIGWGVMATSDGKKVGARPMGGLAWKGDELWCATSKDSDKIAQLQKVPYAEFCFCEPTGKHVRLAGPCTISTDNAEKLWLYNQVPELKNYIPDPAAPEYVVIKLKPENVRIMESADLNYTQIPT